MKDISFLPTWIAGSVREFENILAALDKKVHWQEWQGATGQLSKIHGMTPIPFIWLDESRAGLAPSPLQFFSAPLSRGRWMGFGFEVNDEPAKMASVAIPNPNSRKGGTSDGGEHL